MVQNVITAEFQRDESAYEAYRRMENHSSTRGYEIYRGALVKREDSGPQVAEQFSAGTLNRSHIGSDWAVGAILGILFGLHGLLIGSVIGLLVGTFYDSRQLSHDQKLLQEASQTAGQDTMTLVLVTNEKYEDALDQQLLACGAVIHRAYSSDLEEEIKTKRAVRISLN